MDVEIDSGKPQRNTLALGCLIVVGVLVVVLAGGGWFVWSHWKGWTADAMESVMMKATAKADIDDAEKAQVEDELRRLTAGFRRGDVTVGELLEVAKAVTESPLIPAAVLFGARTQYLDPSGLSDEEKAAGTLALSRLAHGVYDGSIDPAVLSKVFGPISTTSGSGRGVHVSTPNFQLHLRPPADVTDDELLQVITLATQQADDAGVPDEPYTIDASDEIAKVIGETLGRELPPPDEP